MNSYVVFDASRLQNLLNVVKISAGNAVNIGISILAIIMGILIVIMIVRKFSRV